MKRKRNDSSTANFNEKQSTNKIHCLTIGSHVEVQFTDGKWHSGIVNQCQSRKYLVQVDDQQHWIDINSIRSSSIVEHKRRASFEYRPGQFLRNETKNPSEDKISFSTGEQLTTCDFSSSSSNIHSTDLLDICFRSDRTKSNSDSKKKRLTRPVSTTNSESKKSPFVWKPSTLTTIQTRRSSKNGSINCLSPEQNSSNENLCRSRSLSNENKNEIISSNSLEQSSDVHPPTSEVLIFRPIIRFVESDQNQDEIQSNLSTSNQKNISIVDRIEIESSISTSKKNSREDDDQQVDLDQKIDKSSNSVNELINLMVENRSSCKRSNEKVYLIDSYQTISSTVVEQTNKSESKVSCFLETPPPSLPDIHVSQDSESPSSDKQPVQQCKSKRKQDRPQRKQIPSLIIKQEEQQGKQLNGLLDRLILKQKDEDCLKPTGDLCDPGYLSDEYSEPINSNKESTIPVDLEEFYQKLKQFDEQRRSTSDKIILNNDDQLFYQQFHDYIGNNSENYQQIDKYRSEYYNDENNPRIRLISNILKRIFLIGFNRNLMIFVDLIPDEIKVHMKLCLNNILSKNIPKQKKILTRGKRFIQVGQKSRSNIKTKRLSLNNEKNIPTPSNVSLSTINQSLSSNDSHFLLSPSSPLTPLTSKLNEQQSNEDLLSPNSNNKQIALVEQLTVLPKERDIYEVIHCLCQSQLDNGFMIQCETCLCWSHCECVDVTANCIPAFFKCCSCRKAEDDRRFQCSISSLLEDNPNSSFILNSSNSDKTNLLFSYFRRLWQLRERMSELKLKSTPILRSLQSALRSDDLNELCKYVDIDSDRLKLKIVERKLNREHVESVSETIEQLVDDVCFLNNHDQCLSIGKSQSRSSSSELVRLLKRHICDDQEIRQIRQSIEHRYKQTIDDLNKEIHFILREHQDIEDEIRLNFGFISDEDLNQCLSYDKHQTVLRTAIERFKS